MKRLALPIAVSILALLPVGAGASPGQEIVTDGRRYSEGEPVRVTANNYHQGTQFAETLAVYTQGREELVAQYYLSEDERGADQVTWLWDQRHACYGQCQNVWEGDPAKPGKYEVWLEDADGGYVDQYNASFSIGAYFHLGFEGRPNTDFVVFTHKADAVEQMRAELEKPEEERQIVAGKVRARKPGYNKPWSYVLGPGSVFLGEVFIEVCDGSPGYVERHLKQWRGEQWCPWSSHVESEGL